MSLKKYYYNKNNYITDGEREYTWHRKDRVRYLDGSILYGLDDLLDLLNELYEENQQLKDRNVGFIDVDELKKKLGLDDEDEHIGWVPLDIKAEE